VSDLPRLLKTETHTKFFVGKSEGKRPLGRHGHKWEDIIKIDIVEIGWENVNWINVAESRDKWRALVSTIINRVS
jgi:hypothetical protein